mgnify:CR=1 FL=1
MGAKLLIGLAIVGLKLFGGSGTTVKDAPPGGDTSGATPPPDEPKPQPKPGLSPATIKRNALMADASFGAAMVGTPASPSIPASVSGALTRAGQAWAISYVASASTAISALWGKMTDEEKSALWRGEFK